MATSYREIEERLNTQTNSVLSGYPERGPFDSADEAWGTGDKLPRWATVIKVYQDDRGWWAVYTCTTSTSLLPSISS